MDHSPILPLIMQIVMCVRLLITRFALLLKMMSVLQRGIALGVQIRFFIFLGWEKMQWVTICFRIRNDYQGSINTRLEVCTKVPKVW